MINFTKKLSILAFCLLFFLVFVPEANIKASEITTETVSGTGTQEDPYILTTGDDLSLLQSSPSSYFELGNDIDLENAQRTCISGFTGTLDGKGYSISNFSLIYPDSDDIGFFRVLYGGTVKNLTLVNETVAGTKSVGGLAGHVRSADAVIQNCHVVNSTIQGSDDYIGGLIGRTSVNVTETISDCSVEDLTLYVNGANPRYVGGLIGASTANIFRCFVTGNITSDANTVGGLLGSSSDRHTVSECYADVDINLTQSYTVGGLIGQNNSGTVINCFTIGSITDPSEAFNISGLIGTTGATYDSYIINCYSAMNITNNRFYVLGIVHTGTGQYVHTQDCFYDNITIPDATANTNRGRHSIYMRKQETFTNWDFENVWTIDEDTSYPYLRNLSRPADLSGPGSAEHPYIVSTPEEVDLIRYDLDAYYEVVCDIDMAGYDFVMIGTKKNPFVGVINGNGHTIYNLSDVFVRYNSKYIINDLDTIEAEEE